MQSVPVQTPELQKVMKTMSGPVTMSCRLDKNEMYLHWYRQLPGEPPKRLLYESGGTPVFEGNNDRDKFQVQNDPTQPVYSLIINPQSLTPRDSGIYYCAYWVYHGISWAKISLTKRLFVL